MNQPDPLRERLLIRKNKKKEALWMLSFSDLCLILMCLFALIISISTIDNQKFDNITGNMAAKTPAEKKKEKNLKSIKISLQKEIEKRKLKNTVEVKLDADGLAIEFKDKLLFRSGSAAPNAQYRQVVGKVLQIIAKAPKKYEIELEGHTDDVKLSGRGRYRNNWELSSARGLALLSQLKKRGVSEKRMHIRSYAHTRPKIATNRLPRSALAAARAANRRVVIRLN
ncbi:OmpA family protein [Oligoflexaceae bacterium]|nr:OmpA family protein [Oligoflexaceae bacterium]